MYTYFYRKSTSGSWLDVSRLVNSSRTSIVNGICTREFKSTTNTASFEVLPVDAYIGLYRQLLEDLIEAQGDMNKKLEARIKLDGRIVASGYIDLASVEVTSKKVADRIKITIRDYIIDLDKKCKGNLVREGVTYVSLTEELLSMAGIKARLHTEDKGTVVNHFVLTEDDGNTFREIIDTLLFEMGNKVLYRNPTDGDYYIRPVICTKKPTTFVNYLINKSLVTSSKVWDYDGLIVKYPTVDSRENVSMYIDDASTKVEGVSIPSMEFYPKDGDVKAIYQDYRKDILDIDYNSKISRRQNGDLDLLYVKDAHIEIAPKSRHLAFSKIPEVGLDENPKFYPRKAQCLIRNTDDKPYVLNQFDIIGTAVFRSKVNSYTVPKEATQAQEYEASYIETDEQAKAFATGYLNLCKYGSTIATWTTTDNEELYPIGTSVIVRHKAGTQMSQGFTVISMELVMDKGIVMRKYVAIANSEYDAYSGVVNTNNPTSSNKKVAIKDVLQFYLSTDPVYPENGNWTDDNPIEKDPSLDGYLFARRFVRYTDGTEYISSYYRVGAGESASSLILSLSIDRVPYFADNFPVDSALEIIATVQAQNLKNPIEVSWLSKKEVLPVGGGSVRIPLDDLTRNDSIMITAKSGSFSDTRTVSKSFRPGELSLFSNGTTFYYYADNVPHDPTDKINVGFSYDGFFGKPTLNVDGVVVEPNPDNTYDVPVSALQNKDSIEVYAHIASYRDAITLRKQKDVASLNLVLSGTQFFYSADNMAHDAGATIVAAVRTSGISQKPTLKVDGQLVTLGATNEYVISTDRMKNENTLNLEANCFTLTRTATINKVVDVPSITLTLSTDHFTYYADNVVKEGQPDIIASVASLGLMRGVALTVGGKDYPLNESGQAMIPSSVLDGNIESIEVKAMPKFVSTISMTQTIKKEYMTPFLTLLTDAGQFAFDKDNKPTPTVINIEYRTEGLSSAVVPRVKVQNRERQWENGKLEISYLEIVTVNFLKIVADIERFNLKRELMINRVSDSKAIVPIVEYAYGASQTKPPAFAWLAYGDFVLKYGEFHLGVNDGGWGPGRPEVVPEGKPYLWMRISVDGGYSYTYSPLTGPRGEDGKDGMQNVYCGVSGTAPYTRPDGLPLVVGDYYLNATDQTQPVPYILRENGVWSPVTPTDPEWASIAAVTREDVMALGSTLKTTSSYYAYFAMLSSQNGFIDNLGTQNLVVKKGGSIQSENYATSEGIEGWKIDSNGDADFNNGTWRGSFANGLVFNAPTHVEIDKDMTQREAYKLMKKAGIVSGVYNGRSSVLSKFQSSMVNSANPSTPARCADYSSFSCLDYDTDKIDCNIPIVLSRQLLRFKYYDSPSSWTSVYAYETPFGPCAMIIPFSFSSYILVIVKEKDNPKNDLENYELDGYYVLTKTALERFLNQRTDADPVMTDIIRLYGKYQNTPAYDYYAAMREYFGVFKIPQLDYAFYSFSNEMHFYVYPVITDTRCTIFADVNSNTGEKSGTLFAISTKLDSEPKGVGDYDVFTLDFPGIKNPYLTGYFTMLTSIQTEGDSVILSEFGRSPGSTIGDGSDDVRNFYKADLNKDVTLDTNGSITGDPNNKILHFSILKSFPKEKSLRDYALEAVTYEGRIFALGSDSYRKDIMFGELTETGFRPIPDETLTWSYVDNAKYSVSNLFLKDGIIYGSVNGSVWRYDIASDKFYDMSPEIAELFNVELIAGEGMPTEARRKTRVSALIGMHTSVANQAKSVTDPIYFGTDAVITNICWDNKEQSILFNLKTRFQKRNDINASIDQLADNDSFICVPVFYNPVTKKYKLFAMATNQFRRMALPYGRFTSISDSTRRVFASDSCVLFMSGIKLQNNIYEQKNWPVDELLQHLPSFDGGAGPSISMMPPELTTLHQDYVNSSVAGLYGLGMYGVFELSTRYYENGRKSRGLLVPTDVLKIGAVFPFFSRRIIVREDANSLKLLVPIVVNAFTMSNYYSEELTNGAMFKTNEMLPYEDAWDGYLVGDSMEPFIVIDKNSDEPVGASFIWHFPAQFTTIEGLGQVIDMITNAWDLIDNNFLKFGDVKHIEAIARKVYEEMQPKK